MPSTSRGLRYPASSAAPNVPQDLQNLASDVDTRFSRFNHYSVNWPSTTVSGTNNIGSSVITVPAQSGPYALVVTIGVLGTMVGTGGATPDLWMLINGATKARNLFKDITTSSANLTKQMSRSFYVSDGTSRTVQGKIDIPAGATVTTYTDDSHSYVTAFTVPMW